MPNLLAVIFTLLGFVLLYQHWFFLAFVDLIFIVGLLIQSKKSEVIDFETHFGSREKHKLF
jgi:mannose/fructose/N-acetylgalactosamine-specific phosphotransferase system component IID